MKYSQFTAPDHPSFPENGGVIACVETTQVIGGGLLMIMAAPAGLMHEASAGRYFLARCTEPTPWAQAHDWTLSLRRPLFVAGWRPALSTPDGVERWTLTTPALEDAGVRWLAARKPGECVHLIGPLGNGFTLPPRTQRLALISEPARILALAPLLHAMLDRGGSVLILLKAEGVLDAALRNLLPFAVEVHQEADEACWRARLREAMTWADAAAAALPAHETATLAEAVRAARMRIEKGLVQCLVDVRLACGYGACLVCLTPLANGRWTRACMHGPVFDLVSLSSG
uniref:Dihydroorotate dehydrogenase electron transfer subunit iron-sulphur cluster binding domain-containing protein n=1 Tax=Caldilinea aerophila TaxID=133453 RepID=A0A7C1JL14_9CHLR